MLTSEHPAQENIKNKKNHSTIWGKLGKVVQGYTLNPCTRFPPNPISTKVNTDELTSQQPTKENIKNKENHSTIWGKLCIAVQGYILNHCTKFAPNPTSTKVNTDELTSEHPAQENIKNKENHSTIWDKLGTVVQGYTLNPCTRFPPNPTSTKVNTEELTSQQPAKENIENKENHSTIWGKLGTVVQGCTLNPCTRFPPNPKSTKVNNEELTSQQPTKENIKNREKKK